MLKKYAAVLVVISGCCWASMGIFVRFFNEIGLHSLQIVELRAICTTALFAVYILIKDRNLFKVKIKDIWCFFGTGCIGVTLFTYCYYETIKVASLSIASILLYTAPIFVMLLSAVLFSEKITGKKIIALLLAFSGCILVSGIFGSETGLTLKAFFIGICSGIGYALYTIFSKYAVEKGYVSITVAFYTFVAVIPISVAATEQKPVVDAVWDGGVTLIMYILLFAIATTIIPNTTYLLGLKYIEAGKASVMVSIEPVMATTFGLIVFSEIPTIYTFIGIAMIVAAIAILNLRKKEATEEAAEIDAEQ